MSIEYDFLHRLLCAEQRRNELLEEILLELKNHKGICVTEFKSHIEVDEEKTDGDIFNDVKKALEKEKVKGVIK